MIIMAIMVIMTIVMIMKLMANKNMANIFPTDWWLSMRKSSLGWSVSQKRCFLIIFLILTLILGFLKRDHDSPLISFTN